MSLYTHNKCSQNFAGTCFNTCAVRPTSSPPHNAAPPNSQPSSGCLLKRNASLPFFLFSYARLQDIYARADGPNPSTYYDHICSSPRFSPSAAIWACLQQEIRSAPPNEPSSILGHFAVRIHLLTKDLRMDHPSLP